jgi:chromosome segregation ATPase
VDAEWPVQLQNALGKIWDMYNSTLSEGLEDAANKAGQIKELAAEKTKFEQKYYTLILDVNKMIDDAEKRVIEKNFAKLNECSEVEEVKKEKNLVMQELQDVKREKQVLMQEVQLVKRENHVLMQEVQQVKLEKTEVLQELEEVKKEKTEVLQELALLKDSQKQLKEEKKKLEYMIYDHLKASDANKGKLQRIKQIMEE